MQLDASLCLYVLTPYYFRFTGLGLQLIRILYGSYTHNIKLYPRKWTERHYVTVRNPYLSTILGAFTRQVLTYVLSDSLEADFVLETVNRLLEQHRISLSTETLIHSNQGCHYTSCRFIQIVKDAQLCQSMSRRGNCWNDVSVNPTSALQRTGTCERIPPYGGG